MNTVERDIFQAIHEGKGLKIEYKNKSGETTKYWIGIHTINPMKRTLFDHIPNLAILNYLEMCNQIHGAKPFSTATKEAFLLLFTQALAFTAKAVSGWKILMQGTIITLKKFLWTILLKGANTRFLIYKTDCIMNGV